MGELLDRDFQRELLQDLQGVYPKPADLQRSYGKQSDNRLLVNLFYLAEHDLVELKTSSYHSGDIGLHYAKITAKGMDFIADDGGLSAVLGTVTVRLHDDTVRDLLIRRVQSAEGDASVKDRMIDRIKGLPAEALGRITIEGLDRALARAPDALTILKDALL